jgi:phosphosulfolactate phosphohydrolase-like enzyme
MNNPTAVRRFRTSPTIQTRLFDGEMVILDMSNGEYLALDAIGSRLLAGLQVGRAIQEMATEVVEEYDVSLEQAKADLEALADDLVRRGVLVVDG